MDPLAEEGGQEGLSPYHYGFNNPIKSVDPDGMLSQSVIDDIWNNSTNGTTWTNNGDGTFSSNTGKTVNTDGGDPPSNGKRVEEKKEQKPWYLYFCDDKIYNSTDIEDDDISEMIKNGNYYGGTAPLPGIGSLGNYAKLLKATKGFKGAIQAHHLVEVRHLKRLLMSTRNAPSVILSKSQHATLTKTLQNLLPYGKTYTKAQIISAYQQAYKSNPEWVSVVIKFLQ